MPAEKNSFSLSRLFFQGLFLSLLGILFFTGNEFANDQIVKEGQMITQELGAETSWYVRGKADQWFDDFIVSPGVEESVVHFFIPTQEEKLRSRGMENMGNTLFPWVEERISVFFDLVYWVFKRVALLLIWIPLLLPLLFVSFFDGLCQRNIKKQNFALASPFWQKFGMVGTLCVICGLFLLFCIPISIPPIWAPVMLSIISVLTGISVGNIQKRL